MEEIVSGIDAFRETFVPYADDFIVIGGSACRAVLQDIAIRPPRKTVDIDMVLVPQELSEGFIGALRIAAILLETVFNSISRQSNL